MLSEVTNAEQNKQARYQLSLIVALCKPMGHTGRNELNLSS